MTKRFIFLALAFGAATAAGAQQPNPLAGTWTMVYANDERAEGPALPLFGAHPSGLLMFDNAGNYSLQICASGRPKFAEADRLLGTATEYRDVASACNTHWGHYLVNESEGTIVFKIEHALFTNWEGTEQIRPFRLQNEFLKYQVPTPATAAQKAVVVWKREGGDLISTRREQH